MPYKSPRIGATTINIKESNVRNLFLPSKGLWNLKTDIKDLQGLSGCYALILGGVVRYIGSGSNIYKNALRHFELRTTRSGLRLENELIYPWEIKVWVFNSDLQTRLKFEQYLIDKYKPTDNELAAANAYSVRFKNGKKYLKTEDDIF